MIETAFVLLLICLCRPGSRPAPKAFYTNTIGVPPLRVVPRPPPLPGARRGGGA